MNREEIVNLSKAHSFFTWSVQSQVQPLTAERAEGVYFWDADGNRYLDFSSQLMNVNAGHGNLKIVAAIQEQAAKMAYAYPGIATEPKARLGQLLAEITPGRPVQDFVHHRRRRSQRERHQVCPPRIPAGTSCWPVIAPFMGRRPAPWP